ERSGERAADELDREIHLSEIDLRERIVDELDLFEERGLLVMLHVCGRAEIEMRALSPLDGRVTHQRPPSAGECRACRSIGREAPLAPCATPPRAARNPPERTPRRLRNPLRPLPTPWRRIRGRARRAPAPRCAAPRRRCR